MAQASVAHGTSKGRIRRKTKYVRKRCVASVGGTSSTEVIVGGTKRLRNADSYSLRDAPPQALTTVDP